MGIRGIYAQLALITKDKNMKDKGTTGAQNALKLGRTY